MTTVLWSLDSLDWTLKDPNAVITNVTTNIRNGDIILMHRNPTSVAALPGVIEKLREMGYTFLRLDELLGIKAYR
jgi:peptidoglycan/xylan/chitin deacetylase (PgdA/CDA1 family)